MSWEQVSNSIKFIAFYVASKLGKTGLTVTVDVYNPAGTEVVTAASATELGDGFYYYTLASGSVTAEGEYVAIFKTADTSVDQQHIPALWVVGRAGVEHLDADVGDVPDAVLDEPTAGHGAGSAGNALAYAYTAANTVITGALTNEIWDEAAADHNAAGTMGQKLNAAGGAADPLTNTVPGSYAAGSAGYALGKIGTGTVNAIQPTSGDGTQLLLVRGDDYAEAEGRQISFSSTEWPNLTGVTSVTLTVRNKTTDLSLFAKTDKTASRIVGTGTQTIVFELAPAQTGVLVPGTATGKFDVEAVLTGRLLTLVTGKVNVTEDQTRA